MMSKLTCAHWQTGDCRHEVVLAATYTTHALLLTHAAVVPQHFHADAFLRRKRGARARRVPAVGPATGLR